MLRMSEPAGTPGLEPRRGALVALAVQALATLTVTWPMLAGRLLVGDDQVIAGYAFRRFGAEAWRQGGAIPEWNPYLFGGLPYVAAQHGDIFYPTAWLRRVLPLDTAMNLGFALHFLLAGFATYLLIRALRGSWTAAVVGGIAYQLTGIVASLVSPGHDGKLFVSALAPLLLFALVRAVRDGRIAAYGLVALTVGLAMLSPQYQMTYYTLVAGGIWTLWLVFFAPDRRPGLRWPVALGAALGAVLLGLAIAAIQVVPFLDYIPFSPRAEGGPSSGWEYATGFSMPVAELFTTILPEFNGVLQQYWGSNFFKLHTEYLGASVVLLALIGATDRTRRRTVAGLAVILVLFLLISLGGNTPFYRLWYEVMPMMQKVRAPGMAFFLVALPVAVFAGFGVDRLLAQRATSGAILGIGGALAAVAVLGVAGVLQELAASLADPAQLERVFANEPALRSASLRLLLVATAATAVAWSINSGRLRGAAAVALLAIVVTGDLWAVDRKFFHYRQAGAPVFPTDPVVTALQQAEKPYRVLDLPFPQLGGPVYPGSVLMGYEIPQVLGYHGFELRYYDELLGGKNVWRNLLSPQVMDLVAARFLILREAQPLPGWHQVAQAEESAYGGPAVLMERDTVPPYARVVGAAARLPEEQVIPTLLDPGFPVDRLALYSDTASITPAPLAEGVPAPSPSSASITAWAPGAIDVAIQPAPADTSYLVVAENWYSGWTARVNDRPAAVHRADHTFLSVVLPPGATTVRFRYDSDSYDRGRLITLLAVLASLGLCAAGLRRPKAA